MIDSPYASLFYRDSVKKEWKITCEDVVYDNSSIEKNSISIAESLCSTERLTFGRCEASTIEFTLRGVTESMKGKDIAVSVVLDGLDEYEMQVGTYKIEKDVPSADRKYRQITAHDKLYTVNNFDATSWYNGLTFPISIKNFRDSFFAIEEFGIEQETIDLPNDSVMLNKTITYGSISGAAIVAAICEANGCFGHMGRDGLFNYIFLGEIVEGLYPKNDLYPSDDLYPKDEIIGIALNRSNYISIDYEDFKCKAIDKICIEDSNGSVAATYGDGDNIYYMDNPLLYGLSASVLNGVLGNIYSFFHRVVYWPCEIDAIGNLCVEVGDSIRLNTSSKIFYTYVLQRSVSGTSHLVDNYISTGEEVRTEKLNSVSTRLNNVESGVSTLNTDLETTNTNLSTTNSNLNGVSSRVGSLEADHVSVSELNATNARIGSLEADHVSVGSLNAVSARVGTLEANQVTADRMYAWNVTFGRLATIYSYIIIQNVEYRPTNITIGATTYTVLARSE